MIPHFELRIHIATTVPEFSGENDDLIQFIAIADKIHKTLQTEEEQEIFNTCIKHRLTDEAFEQIYLINPQRYQQTKQLLQERYAHHQINPTTHISYENYLHKQQHSYEKQSHTPQQTFQNHPHLYQNELNTYQTAHKKPPKCNLYSRNLRTHTNKKQRNTSYKPHYQRQTKCEEYENQGTYNNYGTATYTNYRPNKLTCKNDHQYHAQTHNNYQLPTNNFTYQGQLTTQPTPKTNYSPQHPYNSPINYSTNTNNRYNNDEITYNSPQVQLSPNQKINHEQNKYHPPNEKQKTNNNYSMANQPEVPIQEKLNKIIININEEPAHQNVPLPNLNAVPSPAHQNLPLPNLNAVPSPAHQNLPLPNSNAVPSPAHQNLLLPNLNAVPSPAHQNLSSLNKNEVPSLTHQNLLLLNKIEVPSLTHQNLLLLNKNEVPSLTHQNLLLLNKNAVPSTTHQNLLLLNKNAVPSPAHQNLHSLNKNAVSSPAHQNLPLLNKNAVSSPAHQNLTPKHPIPSIIENNYQCEDPFSQDGPKKFCPVTCVGHALGKSERDSPTKVEVIDTPNGSKTPSVSKTDDIIIQIVNKFNEVKYIKTCEQLIPQLTLYILTILTFSTRYPKQKLTTLHTNQPTYKRKQQTHNLLDSPEFNNDNHKNENHFKTLFKENPPALFKENPPPLFKENPPYQFKEHHSPIA